MVLRFSEGCRPQTGRSYSLTLYERPNISAKLQTM